MNQILTFAPVYVHLIWGGDRIASFKGIPSQGTDIGESWELSPMPGHESVADAGPFKGRTLNSLIAEYGDDIMGPRLMKEYDGQFPLLIKLIDSKRDLSIQVHPDDKLGAELEGKRGKTEMWYSVDPEDGAYLYAGFKGEETPESFKEKIRNSTIVDALNKYYTRPGDVFFLPAGCVHAIGRGNFVVEIQEASDVTYRIFDYNRLGADGKPRELHVEKSAKAVKFDNSDLAKPRRPEPVVNGAAEVVHCNYFNTDLLDVDGEITLDLGARDSFTVLITTEGTLTVTGADGQSLTVGRGRTMLLPVSLPSVKISGKGKLISCYIP